MRDGDIIQGFAKIEKKMHQLIEDHYILSYHFTALQRILMNKKYIAKEDITAELMKMQREIDEAKTKTQAKPEPVVEAKPSEPVVGGKPDDKPTGEGSKEAVPDTGNKEGQVLPNQELPKPETGAVRPPSLIQRLWRATFGRKRGGSVH